MHRMQHCSGFVQEGELAYSTAKCYTYQDYLVLPAEECYRYEILEGMLVREPAPVIHHQHVLVRLTVSLYAHFQKVDPAGVFLPAPVDVVLSSTNVVQPDLVYVSGTRSCIVDDKRINGAPDLLIEIISPSTRAQDQVRKRSIYERYGVIHYWIADPVEKAIQAYALRNGAYELCSKGEGDAVFVHRGFPTLALPLKAVWPTFS